MERKVAISILVIISVTFCMFLYKTTSNIEEVLIPNHKVDSAVIDGVMVKSAVIDSLKTDSLKVDSIK